MLFTEMNIEELVYPSGQRSDAQNFEYEANHRTGTGE